MEAARDGDGAPLITALGNEKPKARRRSPVPDLHSSRPIYRTRLTLRILSTAMCFVIIGVLIDAVRTYHATKHVTEGWSNGNGRFEVWPTSLSMKSTNTLLGAAAVGAALSLALTLASCVSSIRHMTKVGNILTFLVSFVSLALWIAATAYYGTWSKKGTKYDLQSWTCKHSDFEYNEIDFSELCTQVRVGFWGAVGLGGLELANLILFLGWWIHSRRNMKGYRKF